MPGRGPALACLLLTLGCGRQPDLRPAPPEPAAALTEVRGQGEIMRSPNGSESLIFNAANGKAEVTLSAGFLRRSHVGTVGVPALPLWSPDSRRFLINDPGAEAAPTALRVWTVDNRAGAVESTVVRDAVERDLGRRSPCGQPVTGGLATIGMAWADHGRQVYVLGESLGTDKCPASTAFVAVVEVETGRILDVRPETAARHVWPGLPWSPVTAP